jgi:hypothetical protein
MMALDELPALALGIVVTAGVGFLIWALYHLALETHPTGTDRRSR